MHFAVGNVSGRLSRLCMTSSAELGALSTLLVLSKVILGTCNDLVFEKGHAVIAY